MMMGMESKTDEVISAVPSNQAALIWFLGRQIISRMGANTHDTLSSTICPMGRGPAHEIPTYGISGAGVPALDVMELPCGDKTRKLELGIA